MSKAVCGGPRLNMAQAFEFCKGRYGREIYRASEKTFPDTDVSRNKTVSSGFLISENC